MSLRNSITRLAGGHPAPAETPPEVWAHCPRCDTWFFVDDPSFDSLLLCPADLHRADTTEVRLSG